MKTEIKNLWTSALLNGDYKQTKGYLHKEDCFCALGVLVDIYLKEKGLKWIERSGGVYAYSLGEGYLNATGISMSIKDWADMPINLSETIMIMNDDEDKSFAEIAYFLKAN